MNVLDESNDDLGLQDNKLIQKGSYNPDNNKALLKNDYSQEDSDGYLSESYRALGLSESGEVIDDPNIKLIKDRLGSIDSYFDSIKDNIKNLNDASLFNEQVELLRDVLGSNIKIKTPGSTASLPIGGYLNGLRSLKKDKFPEHILAEVGTITKSGEQYAIKWKGGSECIVTLEQPNPNLPNDKKVIFVSGLLEVTVR